MLYDASDDIAGVRTMTAQDTSGHPSGTRESGGLPATGKLVDSHPLLARLTGQVVWNLAEECAPQDSSGTGI
jgi:hypothetical protein